MNDIYRTLLIVLNLLLPASTFCQSTDLVALEAEVFLKLLSQNRTLYENQHADTVRILIVAPEKDSLVANHMAAVMVRRDQSPFSELPYLVDLATDANWVALLGAKIHGAVLLAGSTVSPSAFHERCVDSKVLSMTNDSSLVRRGISLGVTINEKTEPEISFNFPALRREGATYSQNILQLVTHQIWE